MIPLWKDLSQERRAPVIRGLLVATARADAAAKDPAFPPVIREGNRLIAETFRAAILMLDPDAWGLRDAMRAAETVSPKAPQPKLRLLPPFEDD